MAESYVEALEKKIAELAGIPMEAIRKNKWNDLMNEGDAIKESTDFINNIVVAKQANATASKVNPLISKIFGLVEREAKQAGGAAMLPELGYIALGSRLAWPLKSVKACPPPPENRENGKSLGIQRVFEIFSGFLGISPLKKVFSHNGKFCHLYFSTRCTVTTRSSRTSAPTSWKSTTPNTTRVT